MAKKTNKKNTEKVFMGYQPSQVAANLFRSNPHKVVPDGKKKAAKRQCRGKLAY